MKKETTTKAAKPAEKHTKTASKSVGRKTLKKTRGGFGSSGGGNFGPIGSDSSPRFMT